MGWHEKFYPAFMTPLSALITPFPVNALPNKLAANVPNSIGRNPCFCYFVSFLIVLVIPFTINPDSSSDLTFSLYLPFLHSKLLML